MFTQWQTKQWRYRKTTELDYWKFSLVLKRGARFFNSDIQSRGRETSMLRLLRSEVEASTDPALFTVSEECSPCAVLSRWGPSLIPGPGTPQFCAVEQYSTAVKGRGFEFWVQSLTPLLLSYMTISEIPNFSMLPNSYQTELTLVFTSWIC